jgi:hypothetical protein
MNSTSNDNNIAVSTLICNTVVQWRLIVYLLATLFINTIVQIQTFAVRFFQLWH